MSTHCVLESQHFLVYRVRDIGDFQDTINRDNSIYSHSPSPVNPVDVTISVRGVVRNGALAGSVSEEDLETSRISAVCFVRVAWGAGTVNHSIVFSVRKNAVLSVPPCDAVSVTVLSSTDIILERNTDSEFIWGAVARTLIHANVVEVTFAENEQRALGMNQLLSCDLFVPAMGGVKPILEIPASAYRVQYVVYPDLPIEPTLDGFTYPAAPAVQGPPFFVRSIEAGQFVLGAPLTIARGDTQLVDRNSVAIAAHTSAVDTRANITFTIRNP